MASLALLGMSNFVAKFVVFRYNEFFNLGISINISVWFTIFEIGGGEYIIWEILEILIIYQISIILAISPNIMGHAPMVLNIGYRNYIGWVVFISGSRISGDLLGI